MLRSLSRFDTPYDKEVVLILGDMRLDPVPEAKFEMPATHGEYRRWKWRLSGLLVLEREEYSEEDARAFYQAQEGALEEVAQAIEAYTPGPG